MLTISAAQAKQTNSALGYKEVSDSIPYKKYIPACALPYANSAYNFYNKSFACLGNKVTQIGKGKKQDLENVPVTEKTITAHEAEIVDQRTAIEVETARLNHYEYDGKQLTEKDLVYNEFVKKQEPSVKHRLELIYT